MRLTRLAGAAGLVAAVLAAAGCGGDKTGEVTGTVTVDGKPPPAGTSITFTPSDGRGAGAGALVEAGKYTTKVPVGPAKVAVRVPKFAEKAPRPAPGPGGPGPGGAGELVVGDMLAADDKGQTELTYEVKPGSQEKNWDLKTKAK